MDLPIKNYGQFRYLVTIDSDKVTKLPLIVEDYLPDTIELGSYSNPYGLNYTGSSNGYVTNLDWNQTTDYFKLQINHSLRRSFLIHH